MKLIVPPLKQDNYGDQVANLQEALQWLLRRQVLAVDSGEAAGLEAGLAAEKQRQTYAEKTARAVAIFQTQYAQRFHLTVNGEVDNQTAEALNALLRNLDALNGEQSAFVVHGTVRLMDGSPLHNIVVTAFDQYLRKSEELGKGKTNTDGHYGIRYEAKAFTEAEKGMPDLAFQLNGSSGNSLPIKAATDGSGKALAEMKVMANGELRSTFVLFQGPVKATVDLFVDGDDHRHVPSEYERLIAEIEPLLIHVVPTGVADPKPADRLAELKPEEIEFLVRDVEGNRSRLELLASAASIEVEARRKNFGRLVAPVFYGLARKDLPVDPALLALRSSRERKNALSQAIKE